MSQLAEASGLGRESLYKALKPGAQPRYDTVMRVLHALGVEMVFQAAARPASRTSQPAVTVAGRTGTNEAVEPARSKPMPKAPSRRRTSEVRATANGKENGRSIRRSSSR